MKGPALSPWSAPDGKWIYFSSFGAEGQCLFRIAPDGSGLQQLTKDGDARNAVVSPDGKTLYYSANRSLKPRPMQVAAEGGAPVPLADVYFRIHGIAADGTRLLGLSWDDAQRQVVLASYTLKDGTVQLLHGYPTNGLFTPDGGLAGVQRIQGRSVVGVWPPGGGVFKPMAPPTPDGVYGGAVSRTGQIAMSRGQSTNDVVLITAK